MENINVHIPVEVQKIVQKHSEVNWEALARKAITDKARLIQLTEKLVEKSKLKESDIDELDHIIKKALYKRYSK
ncbi:hypothetical protein J4450_07000 [Candidatus Micrarchaeota archaeon]|nr:hypothetical protein [Candidatus Micrarchaeota archaeon]